MNTAYQRIESRLMKMDYEIHSLMREVRASSKPVKLKELIHEIKYSLKEDSDTTFMIKEMRKKEYDL